MNKETSITKICEFYVEGMHCAACEMVVEKSLSKHASVKKAKASLNNQTVSLHIDGDNLENIHVELNDLIKDTGYLLHTSQPKKQQIDLRELAIAFSISLIFVGLFVLLQKFGIVNLIRANQVTLPFVFLIGIVASLSTCMAVVGGLVLSLSSSYAKSDSKSSATPLIKFHLSRIISFFILGGVIGLLGSAFTLTPITTFTLNLILFLVMIVLGINLLGTFPIFRKLQIKIPKTLSNLVLELGGRKSYLTPIILGASTFFLPCGFTQSMQVYSLTTGNFMSGAVIMLVFALGTLPMLALISFASVKLAKGLQSSLFFKTAGFIVLFFALFNFLGALVAIGLISPILNL